VVFSAFVYIHVQHAYICMHAHTLVGAGKPTHLSILPQVVLT